MTKLQERIKNVFADSPGGAQCKFIKLNRKWGIKLFSFPQKRDETWDNQSKCYDVGLAPEVKDCIDLPSGPMRFGYITEVVDTIFNPLDYDLEDEWDGDEDEDPYREIWEWEAKHAVEIRQLQKQLRHMAGFVFDDAHAFNLGYKDGKLIPIDFGIDDFLDRVDTTDMEMEMLEMDYSEFDE